MRARTHAPPGGDEGDQKEVLGGHDGLLEVVVRQRDDLALAPPAGPAAAAALGAAGAAAGGGAGLACAIYCVWGSSQLPA